MELAEHESFDNFPYILLMEKSQEASCRHMIGCNKQSCGKCKERTKDQMIKILD